VSIARTELTPALAYNPVATSTHRPERMGT
jgi:hypothetical protein